MLLPVCSGSCTGPGCSEVAGNLLPRPMSLCHMKEGEIGQLDPIEQDVCRSPAFLIAVDHISSSPHYQVVKGLNVACWRVGVSLCSLWACGKRMAVLSI